jgi:adenosylmethionine-8-amino-7-oxononanoate aminotransferase
MSEDFDDLNRIALDHFWPHAQQVADFEKPDGLHVIADGKGVWVTDVQGREYVDVLSGMWLVNIGYGRTEVADAVYEQMQHVTYAPENTTTEPTLRLAERVAGLAPDKESRVFFSSGGSEAVETALKMARNYHKLRGNGGKYKVISRRGSYHGATIAAASLGQGGYVEKSFGPLLPGNVHVTQPYHYRSPVCDGSPDCNLECTLEAARDIERAIQHEGPDSVAAVVAEPVSAAHVQVPHADYWSTVRKICDDNDVLLIADEVITGFGRTGKMFASEHWDLKPDIMTVAKGLSSGYAPIGATIASKAVSDTFIGEREKAFGHLLTFGGNPVSAAAAMANLDIMIGENMVDNSAEMGSYLHEQLQVLYEHPIVGDINGGLGLFFGIELVKDRDTKEKFDKDDDIGSKLTPLLLERQLLTRQRGDHVWLAPPLCVTREEVDFIVRQLNDAIGEVSSKLD